MKEILQQWMFKSKSYKAHKDHKKLYDALEKSLERDYSDQLLSDLDEARQKKRKRRDLPRTPFGSPPPQPPPPPPPAGASGAPGSEAPSLSKSAASAPYYMAWTTSDTIYELVGISGTQELSPMDSSVQDDSIIDEQIHLSDDEDSRNDHLPKANLRKDWWKPLPEEERPAIPEPAWTIPSSNVSDVEKNWFQMEECYKLLIDQVDWTNPKGDQARVNVNRPLPLGGPLGHVTIQSADLQEHTIAKKDFKNLHPSDFEDLDSLLLQGHLNHLPGFDKRTLSTAVKLWT
nr:hypothetical protein [Tanacetum cinerariifolium]